MVSIGHYYKVSQRFNLIFSAPLNEARSVEHESRSIKNVFIVSLSSTVKLGYKFCSLSL